MDEEQRKAGGKQSLGNRPPNLFKNPGRPETLKKSSRGKIQIDHVCHSFYVTPILFNIALVPLVKYTLNDLFNVYILGWYWLGGVTDPGVPSPSFLNRCLAGSPTFGGSSSSRDGGSAISSRIATRVSLPIQVAR